MAAARKMPCHIICPEEESGPTYNSRMMEMFGAEICTVPVDGVHDAIETKLAELGDAGRKPYFIAGGGHGNLGTQAYVECYEEIRDYERKEKIHFDYIFLASGTGTTQAGLVCGQLIHKDDRKIVGISIARKNPRGRTVVVDSVREYMEYKGIMVGKEETEAAVVFIDKYTGGGYGKDSPEIKDTVKEVLICHGIPLDATYTGKAFHGMKEYIRSRSVSGKSILFIHTGGMPLFFDGLSG